jgi:hypothetical protein
MARYVMSAESDEELQGWMTAMMLALPCCDRY